MRSRITNDSLSFFTNKLVPMSERSFERKVKAEEGGRAGEAKVWEVIIGQIWDCLPGFVDLARDLREVSAIELLFAPFVTENNRLASHFRASQRNSRAFWRNCCMDSLYFVAPSFERFRTSSLPCKRYRVPVRTLKSS